MLHVASPILRTARVLSVLSLLALLATPATMAEEEKQVRMRIESITTDCEEGDCDEGRHPVVLVGEDEHRVLHSVAHGEHGGQVWDGRHHGGGFLGVRLSELTSELRTHFGVPEDSGVMVSRVIEESPAFKAGLQVGDIISAVDGDRVASGGALARAIRSREDGDPVALEIWRDGRLRTLTAVVEERSLPERRTRSVLVDCENGGDCTIDLHGDFDLDDYDCGGAGECEILVECSDGACSCTANGEAIDCQDLHR